MEHEIFIADQSRQWQSGERLGEYFEEAFAVLGFTFAFKSVGTVHVVCFVISAVKEEFVWPQPFVGVKKESNFGRPRSAVHEVAVEKIRVSIRRIAIQSEDLEKIEILSCPTVS